eukprot:6203297-Pleurochrysis_carterae.AAC.3
MQDCREKRISCWYDVAWYAQQQTHPKVTPRKEMRAARDDFCFRNDVNTMHGQRHSTTHSMFRIRMIRV